MSGSTKSLRTENFLPTIILTVNLQRGFLYPQSAFLDIPGVRLFHAHRREAVRLLGPDLKSGPLEMFTRWMRSIPSEDVVLLHLKTVLNEGAIAVEQDGLDHPFDLVLGLEECCQEKRGSVSVSVDDGKEEELGEGDDSVSVSVPASIHPCEFVRRVSGTNHMSVVSRFSVNPFVSRPRSSIGCLLHDFFENVINWSTSQPEPTPRTRSPSKDHQIRPSGRQSPASLASGLLLSSQSSEAALVSISNVRIGIVGLSCDSTMGYLVYELVTRYGIHPDSIGICRALVSGTTQLGRTRGVNQMENLFGIRVYDSIVRFQKFLYPEGAGVADAVVQRRVMEEDQKRRQRWRVTSQRNANSSSLSSSSSSLVVCGTIVPLTPLENHQSDAHWAKNQVDMSLNDVTPPTPSIVALTDATSMLGGGEEGGEEEDVDPLVSYLDSYDFSCAFDRDITRYLYSDSIQLRLRRLSGGFSNCGVFLVRSMDYHQHQEAPTVLKVGPGHKISKEKDNFETVASVLGNSAPTIVGYVELGDRAGIRFRYASMEPSFGTSLLVGSGNGGAEDAGEEEEEELSALTFKDLYTSTDDEVTQDVLDKVIHTTFDVVLGRFYRAAKRRKINLFDLYDFGDNGKVERGWAHWAGGSDTVAVVRQRISEFLAGFETENGHRAILPFGHLKLMNVANFLENDLSLLQANFLHVKPCTYRSFVHGDLNARNIMLDPSHNVWLIDFEYTYQDHTLKDPGKLEADILFELTPVETEDELADAYLITEALLAVDDLGIELPEVLPGLRHPKLRKAWLNVSRIRSCVSRLVKEDRSSLQFDIAMLRYSLFMMCLPQVPDLNKRWALSFACGYAEKIKKKMMKNRKLYVRWLLSENLPTPGRLGITILPGTRQVSLRSDMEHLKSQGATDMVVLCTDFEMMWRYNRKPELLRVAQDLGVVIHERPLQDQAVPSFGNVRTTVSLVNGLLQSGRSVVLVSLAGLGRCGIISSCTMLELNDQLTPEVAIALIRQLRGSRAIENERQESFVMEFGMLIQKERQTSE